jgi:hypothetical protein
LLDGRRLEILFTVEMYEAILRASERSYVSMAEIVRRCVTDRFGVK